MNTPLIVLLWAAGDLLIGTLAVLLAVALAGGATAIADSGGRGRFVIALVAGLVAASLAALGVALIALGLGTAWRGGWIG